MNENYETMRQLRRRFTRIGWGVLIYLAAIQLMSLVTLFVPGEVASTLVSYALTYGLGPLVLWLVIRKLPKGACRNMPLSPRALVRTALVSIGMLEIFAYITGVIMTAVEAVSGQTTSDVLQSAASDMPTWLYLLLVGVFAPLGEEFLFRKVLLDRVRPFGDRAAIWVTAVAFGLFHLNLYQFFYATALGVLFAGVAVKTGKLWHTMVLHSAVNLGSAALSGLTDLGDAGAGIASALVIGLMAFAVWAIWRYRKSYSFDPPQYPASNREVAAAAVRSTGLWVCAVLAMAVSVAIVFIA